VQTVDQLHDALAWLAVTAALALLGAAILTATGRLGSYRLLDAAILVQLAAAAIATLSGVGVVAAGATPRDPLHFVYAAVTLLATPVTRYATRARGARSMGRWHVVAAAVVLGAVLRLFMTGR
jgi:hypothetical protein